MSIGKNLKSLRNRQNVSQQDIADFLGVDRKTYVSWESDAVPVKSIFIPKIAEYLHVEISDLFKERPSEIVINQHNTGQQRHFGQWHSNSADRKRCCKSTC
jgi:transcriptional regulator with XRE-family HTH domain